MKKFLKNIIICLDHVVDFMTLCLILLFMFLSAYMLWDTNEVYQRADAKNYEAYVPEENDTKSFSQLQAINSEVIGWVSVNDTNISYPLLQADNDDKYMNTDAEGNYSLSGSIFLHSLNKPDFTDFNNIIYGHHMEKHMMFGDIGKFTDKEYFESHPFGNIFYDGKNHGIEFYALLQVDAYNDTVFTVCNDDERQAYIDEINSHAIYKRDMDISVDDHLVLLTTCTNDMTNGRNILVGRITEKTYPEKEKEKFFGNGVELLKENVWGVPVVIIAVLLVLVTVLWILRERRKKHEK